MRTCMSMCIAYSKTHTPVRPYACAAAILYLRDHAYTVCRYGCMRACISFTCTHAHIHLHPGKPQTRSPKPLRSRFCLATLVALNLWLRQALSTSRLVACATHCARRLYNVMKVGLGISSYDFRLTTFSCQISC